MKERVTRIVSILYTINDFEGNKGELYSLTRTSDERFDEFRDVAAYLESIVIEPGTQLITNIMKFARYSA